MKKRRVRVKDVLPGDDDRNPFKRFMPPRDERLVGLLVDVQAGKAPSRRTRARVTDLAVHDAPTLARCRAGLREEPSLHGTRADMTKHLLTGRPCWLVYRASDGRLVMFDDYVHYTLAQEIGLEWVDVQILGEAAPAKRDIER